MRLNEGEHVLAKLDWESAPLFAHGAIGLLLKDNLGNRTLSMKSRRSTKCQH